MEKPIQEEEDLKNPLKSEHLKEGVNPIIACIGTPEQFEGDGVEGEIYTSSLLGRDKNSNRNVNYFEDPKLLDEHNFKNAGKISYVISPIDSSNKFSKTFKNCTGLVAAGMDKETGQRISFFSHQDPQYFLKNDDNNEKFVDDLRVQLKELKERCAEGTVDAVIVGGNYFEDNHYDDFEEFRKNYIKSVELLGKEAKNILGFEPVVMTGPKMEHGGKDDVFYDNDNRRLYIIRPEVAKESTKSYLPSEINEQEKKW